MFYGNTKKTTKEFIEDAKKIHGKLFDYSKVDYKNALTKVIIICRDHGRFEQTPNAHLNGQGCRKCKYKNHGENNRKTTKEFIEDAKKIHGELFDYSEVKYVKNNKKVIIKCREHGRFEQTPNAHLNGQGCRKCKKITTKKFIEKAKKIHGNIFDYSEVKYVRTNKNIIIICREHGRFEQTPHTHLKGNGCHKCRNLSKGEKILRKILTNLNIFLLSNINLKISQKI